MYTLQRNYKIYNFTLTASLHYLIKTKNTQNGTFLSQLSQYILTQQQKWVYELSELAVFYKLIGNSFSSLLAENLTL